MSFSTMLRNLNEAKVWRRSINVWGRSVKASSLDRLVCLLLHRAGLMGATERVLLPQLVKPGMTAIDIGANVGLYSLLLSQLIGSEGTLFAFEPEPALYASLTKNRAKNQADNIRTFNCALGEAPGRVSFYRSILNSGDNRLGNFGWQGQQLEVEMVRLDDVLPQHRIDFIKIDVQGFEGFVLRGMDRVFAESPNLTIHMEFWPHGLRNAGTEPRELLEQLARRHFNIHLIDGEKLMPVDDFAALERNIPGKQFVNLVASRVAVSQALAA